MHSSSCSEKRTCIDDAEHKALIRAKEETVQADCSQSRNEIVARIKMLDERSDHQV
jgi:hypothetical protein